MKHSPLILFLLAAFSLIWIGCAGQAPTLHLTNLTEQPSLEIARDVLLENGYDIATEDPNTLLTTFKVDNSDWGRAEYRWRMVVNWIDPQHMILEIQPEQRSSPSSNNWDPVDYLPEDRATKIMNPLVVGFEQRGIQVESD